MKTMRRILALMGVLILIMMYILTMIFAVRKDPAARGLFFGSLAATIILPVLLYAFQIAARAVKPGKSPVIDAVIFDLGRVLVDFPWEQHAEGLGLTPEGLDFVRNTIYESPLWKELDRGTMTREGVIRAFAQQAPELEPDIRKYLETIYDCLVPYPYAEGWLRTLRENGYQIYLLTNWPVGAREEMEKRDALPFEGLLSGAIWSCDVGLLKPDPAIFDALAKRYGLNPARCVFIDDREENVEAARSAGYAAFRFTGFIEAREQLASLGVKN